LVRTVSPSPKLPQGATKIELHLNLFTNAYKGKLQTEFEKIYQPDFSFAYRTIEVHARQDEIQLWWEGELCARVPPSQLRERIAAKRKDEIAATRLMAREGPADVPQIILANSSDPGFLPQDSLGLCIHQGEAWFRNVEIGPLND
jgi:hypothetical protein